MPGLLSVLAIASMSASNGDAERRSHHLANGSASDVRVSPQGNQPRHAVRKARASCERSLACAGEPPSRTSTTCTRSTEVSRRSLLEEVNRTSLPGDISQVVAELSLDDRGRGIGGISLTSGDSGQSHFLR